MRLVKLILLVPVLLKLLDVKLKYKPHFVFTCLQKQNYIHTLTLELALHFLLELENRQKFFFQLPAFTNSKTQEIDQSLRLSPTERKNPKK